VTWYIVSFHLEGRFMTINWFNCYWNARSKPGKLTVVYFCVRVSILPLSTIYLYWNNLCKINFSQTVESLVIATLRSKVFIWPCQKQNKMKDKARANTLALSTTLNRMKTDRYVKRVLIMLPNSFNTSYLNVRHTQI
jgi:hypothetical protein